MNVKSLAFLAGLVALAAFVVWQSVSKPKVGIVDNGRLMSQFGEAIRARKTLDSLQSYMSGNAKQLSDSLDAAVAELKGKYEAAGATEKQSLRAGVSEWNQKMATYQKSTQAAYREKEQELILPVIAKMNDFIETWGRKNGYDAIIGSGMQGGVILMVDDRMDLTARVIVDLNELYGAPEKSAVPGDSAANTKQVTSAK